MSDLTQTVIDAQSKGNNERSETLIINAIKQLKLSRFKPDQTTYLSLTYLAKVCPKVFVQSTNIKENLKALLRRDNGVTNIKGRSDIMLPVLASNILLACYDCPENRAAVLAKIDQWLGSNQKAPDIILHLLVTLCNRCRDDADTVNNLIEMRQHWLGHLIEFPTTVPPDLCIGTRGLLQKENDCSANLNHLKFLVLHDNDIEALGDDISKLVLSRPITLRSMFDSDESGKELHRMISKIFTKLLEHLKVANQVVKKEMENEVFLKLADYKFVKLSRSTFRAIFTFLANFRDIEDEELKNLVNCLLIQPESGQPHLPDVFEDFTLTKVYDIPISLRQDLIMSDDELLIEFGLKNASVSQLVILLQQFGNSTRATDMVLKRLELIQDAAQIKSEIKDANYFNQIIEFYPKMGVQGAQDLIKRLELVP